jgi:hypothetical protein
MNSDFRDLFQYLNDSQAKYLLVGGYAVMHYGEPRYTKDIDIWVEASVENAQKVFPALVKFGAPLGDLSEKDFSEPGFFYQMGLPPTRIDILMSLPGLNFEEAWKERESIVHEGLEVHVISRKDLIVNKKQVARPQDLLDVALLETNKDKK